MKNLTLKLTGVSPLLMHSTASMNQPNEGLRTKSNMLTGYDQAEMGSYRDVAGGLVFPSIAVSRSLWGAASGIKIGKLTARNALSGLLQTVEYAPVLDLDGKQQTEFEVDTRFVRINKARVPCSRAKILEWIIELPVMFDPNILNIPAINELLNRAGTFVGIGDYRPSTGGGPFGRFTGEAYESGL